METENLKFPEGSYRTKDYKREVCSCGTKMIIRPVSKQTVINNIYGYKSCWECLQCGNEVYTHIEFENLRNNWIEIGVKL